MKTFIERVLHQKIGLEKYDELERLPLIIQTNYDLYKMEIGGKYCLLASPKEKIGLAVLRKQQKRLEQLTGLRCVLYLTQMNYYMKDRMVEEGIPFILEDRQVYMPFLGILLAKNEERVLRACSQVSFLTQKLLLVALYNEWDGVTVTMAAAYLDVSKMSVTRCFDEIESLEIPVLRKKGRIRTITNYGNKKEMWETIKPFMKMPVIQEFYLEEDISPNLIKSGNSALSELSMLEDKTCPTCAATKFQLKDYGIKERKQVPKGEEPGCVVQELGYLIPFKDGKVVDPLTVALIMEKEKEEPRINIALEKILEEYVW